MTGKLGIFPAAGGLGGSTLTHLLQRVPATELVLITRKPENLAKEQAAGATIRKGDFNDVQTLEHAFDGISTLNLISYASFQHKHRFKVHKAAIDAALKSGVTHIHYSSLAFAGDGDPDTKAHVMLAHLATERYLAELHDRNPLFTYSIIRQGLYSESFPIYTAYFDVEAPSCEIRIPHDGSGPGLAWAKRDELGEATANLIAQHARDPAAFPYLNKTVLLSGPRVWSLAETVDALSRVLRRPVRIQQVPVEEYVKQPRLHAGLGGEHLAPRWATAYDGIRAGECAVATPTLARILGREPESFETTIGHILSK
ncbi:NAD(P)-binding protein [Aspergillus campestris IBT 28561]|uniref:NAD(P)-binding protein n=1 Tax=Aspergillus campestris (strain IBT 28561) TaxID=1392248 RepID=A0A2I1CWB4_ASPC2|nr:NAD(P)-binding protein [Aspergillus campestris IBT 28561]PKY01909.1 NAD(P)-binding protein [Aspergillus campestris IBT 28561]